MAGASRATTSRTCCSRFDVSELDQRRRLREQSHGMKQKIGIVQALMMRPPVAILDEPTAGLDPLMVQAFRETIAELKRGGETTVFLSSHVLTEVESMCDRIGLVRGGRLVASGTIDEIKRDVDAARHRDVRGRRDAARRRGARAARPAARHAARTADPGRQRRAVPSRGLRDTLLRRQGAR